MCSLYLCYLHHAHIGCKASSNPVYDIRLFITNTQLLYWCHQVRVNRTFVPHTHTHTHQLRESPQPFTPQHTSACICRCGQWLSGFCEAWRSLSLIVKSCLCKDVASGSKATLLLWSNECKSIILVYNWNHCSSHKNDDAGIVETYKICKVSEDPLSTKLGMITGANIFIY